MIWLFTLLLVNTPARASDPWVVHCADTIIDVLLSKAVKYRDDESFDVGLSNLDPQTKDEVYRRLMSVERVREWQTYGRIMRWKVVDKIFSDGQAEHRDRLAAIERSLQDLKKRQPRKLDRLVLESSLILQLGIQDRRLLAKAENRDLLDGVQRGVQAALEHEAEDPRRGNRSNEGSFRRWQAEQEAELLRAMKNSVRKILIGEGGKMNSLIAPVIKGTWGAGFKKLSPKSLARLALDYHDPPLAVPTDNPGLSEVRESWTLTDSRGRRYLIMDHQGTIHSDERDEIHFLFNLVSYVAPDSTASLGEYAFYLDKALRFHRISQLSALRATIKNLSPRLTVAQTEDFLRDLLANREQDLLAIILPLPPTLLDELIRDLRWAGLLKDGTYWLRRARAAEVKNFPAPFAESEENDPLPANPLVPATENPPSRRPPSYAPIQDHKSPNLYRLRGDLDRFRLARVPRAKLKNSPEWSRLVLPRRSGSTLWMDSMAEVQVREQILELPAPENFRLHSLRLQADGRRLHRGRDYRLQSHPDVVGDVYRAVLAPGIRAVRVEASFYPLDFGGPQAFLPPIPAEKLRALAEEFRRIGETQISQNLDRFAARGSVRAGDLSQLYADHALYTYHSAADVPAGGGLFGDAKRFLNADGVLCYKCGQAAETLLRSLRFVYAEESEWAFTKSLVRRRTGDFFADDYHVVVDAFHRDVHVAQFDATPHGSDPRTPYGGYLTEQAHITRRRAWAAEFRGELDRLLFDAEQAKPNLVAFEGPFFDLIRAFREFLTRFETELEHTHLIALRANAWQSRLQTQLARVDVASELDSALAGDVRHRAFMQFHFVMRPRLQAAAEQIYSVLNSVADCAAMLAGRSTY